MNLNELKNKRAELVKQVDALLKEENPTDDQVNEILAKQKEVSDLDAEISKEKKREEVEALRVARAASAGTGEVKKLSDNDKKDLNSYSFLKTIRAKAEGKNLEGIEAEMHQEAEKEAKDAGVSISGAGVPQVMLGWDRELTQNRDMEVGAATAGGHLVATDLEGFVPALRPKLTVREAGAQILSGLVGNLDIPKKTGETSATWEGEKDPNAETTPTVGKLTLTPKRLGAYTEMTKQLMIQSSYGVENMVREDLGFAIQKAVDYAALAGDSGTITEQPDGILYTPGIGAVFAGGAATDGINVNGAAPAYADVINLETAIATENADMGNLSYIVTPGMRGKLKQTKVDAGSGIFVWGQDQRELNGYRALVTTQMPSNFTKGAGTNLHAAIFGNWNELIIGNWAGIDLVIDPYTLAGNAKIKVTINSWWDMVVRHAESFAAGDDFEI